MVTAAKAQAKKAKTGKREPTMTWLMLLGIIAMLSVRVSEDMWDLSRPEFGALFDRTSRVVPLRGATTALQINRRLNGAIRESKDRALTSKVGVVKGYSAWEAEQLAKLEEKDFGGRAIFEANKHPKGIIALTLVLGREEAIERMHAQIRAQVRANRGFKITRG